MLIELKEKSQLTLPEEVVVNLGIKEGDTFEVIEKDGGIFLCPVVVCPKETLEKLAKIIKEHDVEGSIVYDSVDGMFKDFGIDLEDDSDV
ncbi:MAG: AbrB/MazE/SpoVT family DNA-binding domain-containing protein [Defluviitaleaceae bacterium]|nr:AbrB/MazE/SpoVT family DNA-binding domain-containing protein [Defluviitaleaceae bacterium]